MKMRLAPVGFGSPPLISAAKWHDVPTRHADARRSSLVNSGRGMQDKEAATSSTDDVGQRPGPVRRASVSSTWRQLPWEMQPTAPCHEVGYRLMSQATLSTGTGR